MELKKKYGLITAICMVVGIVIGSGVFFKHGKVLAQTGSLPLSILAWVIGGFVMISCSLAFAVISKKSETDGGLVDYVEQTCGKKLSYYVGWYQATIYLPILVAVLAWICGTYTCTLFGWTNPILTNGLGLLFMAIIYIVNTLAPLIAGKLQISATIIKIVPLLFMAIAGTIYGLFFNDIGTEGMLAFNFSNTIPVENGSLLGAVVATAFAYEGWIVVISIKKELINANKNLPLALIIGSIITVLIYILYYIGLAGMNTNENFITNGNVEVLNSFKGLLGKVGGSILYTFIIISCVGTLNGLMLGAIRGIYQLASKGTGPKPEVFSQVGVKTNTPIKSSIIAIIISTVWYFIWIGNLNGWFFNEVIGIDEIVIIFLYAAYIPVFVVAMIKYKDLNFVSRFIIPSIAILGCVFVLFACAYAYKGHCLIFLGLTIIVLAIGYLLNKPSLKLTLSKQKN